MADGVAEKELETGADSGELAIYEIGYHITPSVKEEDVEKIVGDIRSSIEKGAGNFIAEGAPSLVKLSYEIAAKEAGKRVMYDRANFGWIKFEAPRSSAIALEESLKANKNLLRYILFRTVREDTRAKIKMASLREVRRGDTIKSSPKRVEESAAPVSEADLDKALEIITSE